MTKFWTKQRVIILLIVITLGIVFGRLAFRAFMNLMLGGALFGGDFL